MPYDNYLFLILLFHINIIFLIRNMNAKKEHSNELLKSFVVIITI